MSVAPAFEGDRTGADRFCARHDGYYVYVLCRPDGAPFYVGKGTKRRAMEHELEALRHHPIGESNPIKCNVIRKIHRSGGAVMYRIDSIFTPAEQQACLVREAQLISQYRRLHEGGCLTNLAGGLGNAVGAAPHSLARHAATLSGEPADNPRRAILNRFLRAIGPVDSVPIKPLEQIARILPTTPHPSPRKPTVRCAYALVASVSAHGMALSAGIAIPRSFIYEGVAAVIENGVARDILKAGMATLASHTDPRLEAFVLSQRQVDLVVALIGRQRLLDRGLL